MAKLLILIENQNVVAEYVGNDVFDLAPKSVRGSNAAANLYVESPYHSYASMICLQRAQRETRHGK
jgi:hypothetical protein